MCAQRSRTSRRRGFDNKKDGATGNAFNPAFLYQQIEIAAGIRAINFRQLANFVRTEASITPQHAILRRLLLL
jgi:hypothetical protein